MPISYVCKMRHRLGEAAQRRVQSRMVIWSRTSRAAGKFAFTTAHGMKVPGTHLCEGAAGAQGPLQGAANVVHSAVEGGAFGLEPASTPSDKIRL